MISEGVGSIVAVPARRGGPCRRAAFLDLEAGSALPRRSQIIAAKVPDRWLNFLCCAGCRRLENSWPAVAANPAPAAGRLVADPLAGRGFGKTRHWQSRRAVK